MTSLHDQSPEELEALLLEFARNDGPSAQVRKRALSRALAATASIGVGVSAASLAPKTMPTLLGKLVGSSTVGIAAKWIAIGATSGLLATGGMVVARHWSAADAHGARRNVPVPTLAPVVPVVDAPAATAQVLHEEERRAIASHGHEPPPREVLEIAPRATMTSTAGAASVDARRSNAPPRARAAPRPAAAGSSSPVESPEMPSAGPREASAGRAPAIVGEASAAHDPALTPEVRLSRELALLEEARGSLERHAGQDALASLDQYRRDFPSGAMAAEAAALRIEALAAMHRNDDALAAARTFLARWPHSVLAERVRRMADRITAGGPAGH